MRREQQREGLRTLGYALAGGLASLLVLGALAWLIQHQDWIPETKNEPEAMKIALVDEQTPQTNTALAEADKSDKKARPEPPKRQPEPRKRKKLQTPPKAKPPKKAEEKPPEPPPKVVPLPKQNMKMVEQMEQEKSEAPDKPDYLSNIDRKVKEQTRARVTNLQKDAPRAEARPKNKKPLPDKAPDQKDRLAQIEERPEAPPQKARAPKSLQPGKKRAQKAQRSSPLLNMRAPAPKRASTLRPSADKALALRQSQSGTFQAPHPEASAAASPRSQPRARTSLNLSGSPELMAQSLGSLASAKAAVERSRRSQKAGLWDKARARYQSPLENMVPEVRPGNQTALNSRRHPFAKYIATIHRSIHAVWAEGFLRQWDSLPGSSPWNNFERWTRVEIVLLADGRVDSVKTVRPSGMSGFDGVARDTIYSAGPYPEAPAEIRSANGKVYMHWAFHRNAYACGTFGAEPFILDNAGEGHRPDPLRAVRVEGQGPAVAHAGHHHNHHHHPHDQHRAHHRAKSPSKSPAKPPTNLATNSKGDTHQPRSSKAPPRPASSLPPGMAMAMAPVEAPARLQTGDRNSGVSQAGIAGSSPSRSHAALGETAGGHRVEGGAGTLNFPDSPEQRKRIVSVARLWVRSILKHQNATAARVSGYPFSVGGRAKVKNKKTLEKALGPVAQEFSGATIKAIKFLSSADIVQRFGALPAGWQPKALHRFVWVELDADQFMLRVEVHLGRWVVSGFSR